MDLTRSQKGLLLPISVSIFLISVILMISFRTEYFNEFFGEAVNSFPLLIVIFKDTQSIKAVIENMAIDGVIYFELFKIMLSVIMGDIFKTLLSKAAKLSDYAPLTEGINAKSRKFEKSFLFIIADTLLSILSAVISISYTYLISEVVSIFADNNIANDTETHVMFYFFLFMLTIMMYVLYISKKERRARINSFIYVIITEIPLILISRFIISGIIIHIYHSMQVNISIAVWKCVILLILSICINLFLCAFLKKKFSDDENLICRIEDNMKSYHNNFKFNIKALIMIFVLYLLMVEVINIFREQYVTPDDTLSFIFGEIPFLIELINGIPISEIIMKNPAMLFINIGKLFILAVFVNFFSTKINIPWIVDSIRNVGFNLWRVLFQILLWIYGIVFVIGLPLIIYMIFIVVSYVYPNVCIFIVLLFLFAAFVIYYLIEGAKGFLLQSICNTLLIILAYSIFTCNNQINNLINAPSIIIWCINMIMIVLVSWFDRTKK